MEHNLKIIDSKNTYFDTFIKVLDEPHGVTISIKWLDENEIVETDTFPFVCLCKLRTMLEKRNLKLCCKGNRIDVYPSGRMLVGFNAYILKKGIQASSDDIVNIFEPEDNINLFCTVAEQENYYNLWLNSL